MRIRTLLLGTAIAAVLPTFAFAQSAAPAEESASEVDELIVTARKREERLFDVPVAGPGTIHTMKRTGTTALSVDAGRTLLLDKDEMLSLARQVQHMPPRHE